jgi:hypothetical protein
MSGAYAGNRAVKTCYNPYGLLYAEKSKVDWPKNIFLTDRDFHRMYAPFSYFYDSSILQENYKLMGTQMKDLNGEFTVSTRMENGKYQLCSSDRMLSCTEACSNEGALVIGECPALGSVVLRNELPLVIDTLNKLYTFTSHEDMLCFYLFDNLGESHMTGTDTTGRGLAFSKLETGGDYPLYLMIFKGDVDPEVLKSTLENKYDVDRAKVTTSLTKDNCIKYRYGNGYGLICYRPPISIVAFTNCVVRERCEDPISNAMEIL